MAIVKNRIRVSRLEGDPLPGSRGSISGSDEYDDEEGLRTESETDEDDSDGGAASSDVDSGMGSDELQLSELEEPRTELCQVGSESCSIPLELYDLPDLSAVLSLATWNECLSEEERFALAEDLPDMDQEMFAQTIRELFSGCNFHFGSPLAGLFNRLKGGLCDPRVVLYRQGMNFIERREHYHRLRKYQNSMVGSLVRIRNAFHDCAGYGIEERVRLLNILRSQRPLSSDRDGDVGVETDSGSGESGERFWNKRLEMSRHALPSSKPSFGVVSSGVAPELVRIGKENTKGLLKVSAKKAHVGAVNHYPSSVKSGAEKKTGPLVPLLGHPRKDQVAGFDIGTGRWARNHMRGHGEDYEDQGYEISMQGHKNASRGSAVVRAGLLKQGRNHEILKGYKREESVGFGEEDPEGYVESSHYHGRSRNANQEVTVASYDRHSLESSKKTKYPQKDRMQYVAPKGAHVDGSAGGHPLRHSRMQWKDSSEFETGKNMFASDSKARSYKTSPAQMGDSYFHSDHRAKPSQEKIRSKFAQNEGMVTEHSGDSTVFAQSEETESDSSDQVGGDVDMNPLSRRMGYSSGAMEDLQSVVVKSAHDTKKVNKSRLLDGGASIHTREVKSYSTKGKQKGTTDELRYLHDVKLMKGRVPQPSEKLQPQLLKISTLERKRKGMIDLDSTLQKPNYMHAYGGGILDENEDNLNWNRNQMSYSETTVAGRREVPNMPLLGCSAMTKKRKGKLDDMYLDEPDEPVHQRFSATKTEDPDLFKKKGKRKPDAGSGFSTVVSPTPEPVVSERGPTDIELETKAQKKPFTLITPSIHTGFSFSIIHLLSAVRKAMITPHIEDTVGIGNHLDKDGRPKPRRKEENKMLEVASGAHPSLFHEIMDANASERAEQNDLPSLTVQDIVNRVRSNPGDPCILETQEPLQDLVRGVLKIFSSKTAPLGAKGWKALVFYEKSNKCWTWIGPISSSSSDNDTVEEETSSEAWGITHKMLVKLVDAFANWLKCGQETLQQIGSLPAPPITMLPNLDEKERFKDLRAQKSLNTISPSSDEMRAYFRKEEFLRYSVPDRAFTYTAADGRKSIVAPLRRGGGKPTSKARDHFMLKIDRPPHVTILCLVRDAAARLPGSIGTRADVCTLIRDSQYIVEDVSDAQVNQVVSGALDRLHYERDPCVQFDGERKLWVYLHRDREEEDFEDDGTSSTKKWKRQRKETDPSDMGAVNDVSYQATEDPAAGHSSAGHDLNPDLNVDSSSFHAGEKTHRIYNGLRSGVDNTQSYIDSRQGGRSQNNPVSWEALKLNSWHEDRLMCQENSTNEDFDDEAFSRERPAGLLGASFL